MKILLWCFPFYTLGEKPPVDECCTCDFEACDWRRSLEPNWKMSKAVKSCFTLISKPVKRNIKSTFLRIFVSAVDFSGNLLCHSLYNLIWDKNKHDLHCRNTLEKQKWRLYFITREVLDYSACDPQPLNRKLFPVLKYLLTIIFVIW